MVIKRERKWNGAHPAREPRPFTRTLLSVSIALAIGSNNVLADPPRGAFPRPCGGGACSGPGVPSQWTTPNSANSPYIVGNTMTIEQTSRNATFNWRSFDIGADNTVEFVQPSTTSVALNRVWDNGGNPTEIFGKLTANGQVYIVNRNGILFGPESHVDVHTLVATSLDIDDEVFQQGLNTAINRAVPNANAFQGNGKSFVVDESGNPILFAAGSDGNTPGRFKVDENGVPVLAEDGGLIPDEHGRFVQAADGVELQVVVEVAEGAEITSQNYGTIMLFGANVANAGTITTPDGQTILAAGNKVYLQSDSELRGFLVEVDVDDVGDDELSSALAGTGTMSMGNVTNQGTISAPRGNATLAGLAINQQGRVSATSAVTANGSVRLLARDKLTYDGVSATLYTDGHKMSRAGLVTFGAESYTEVALDTEKADAKAVDEQKIVRSAVTVMGRKIELLSGSEIVAPSGDVSLTALANPSSKTEAQLQQMDDVAVRIEAGSRIDVSGVTTKVAMERNVVEAELRGNELADSPLQRDGVLAGQKVLIDVRTVDEDGSIPIANVSNAVAAIERTVAERSTLGGNVTIDSTGSAEFQTGAEINVSGGAVQYRDGYINTTKVVADGVAYDIADADPNRRYDSIVGRHIEKLEKWGTTRTWHVFGEGSGKGRFEQGYVEGKDAGTVTFNAYDPTINGRLIGERQVGPYQREAGKVPNGGELIVGYADGKGPAGASHRTPDVLIAHRDVLDAFDKLAQQAPLPENLVTLDSAFLEEGGFTRASIYSNGTITLAEDSPLTFAAADSAKSGSSELNLIAAQIDIKSSIDAPAGDIGLNAVAIDSNAQGVNSDARRITIADDVTLSARGVWANDQTAAVVRGGAAPDLTAPALIDGGNIALNVDGGGELQIGDRVTMDVSGGAWLQSNGKLKAGKGGAVALTTKTGTNLDYRVSLGKELDLRGYALQQGGTLSLKLPGIVIRDGGVTWATGQSNFTDGERRPIELSTGMFQQGGFGRYDVGATTGDLLIETGSHLRPEMQNIVLEKNYQAQRSGADLAQFSSVERLPDELRKPTDLTLSVSSSSATGTGYLPELRIEQGASIETDPKAVVALRSSGLLDVDGRISAPAGAIKLEVNSQNEYYNEERMLRLGDNAELSVAGAARLQPNELGLRTGEVLAGGAVELIALGGGAVELIALGGGIDMKEGASIDVSGSEAVLDISGGSLGTEATTIASAAGSITAMATESIRLDGELKGESNRDAGAAGGTLSLIFDPKKVPGGTSDRGNVNFPEPKDPQTNQDLVWTIRLSQQSDSGAEIGTGLASLAVDNLTGGGFDAVKLSTPGQIQFDGDVDMRLGRGIVLDTPQLTAKDNTGEAQQVVLDAPYLSLGADFTTAVARDRQTVSDLQPVGGGGQFVAGAGNTHLIDLVGKTVLQGFSATELNSLGDIRLRSVLDEYSNTRTPPAAYIPSGFNSAGSLTLTASQVFPTTLSRFTLSSVDVPGGESGRIVIEPGVAEPNPVLSVAGKITLDASIIENNGVLKAPLGEIQLGADDVGKTQNIALAPGSITSTAADVEQVPFGSTLAGTIWQYDGDSTIAVYNEGVGQFTSETALFDAIPDQRVTLRAQNVDIQDGATVDAHGGGDAVAYEFLPGPGGSRDVLNTANATADGRYVILPWLKDGYAPYDAQAFKGWDLDAGASVEILKAGNGLEAGVYPLLPASYALLPGAYLVTMESGYRDLNASHSTRLLDGTAVVPARMAVSNTTVHDARTLGLTVRKGDYANTLADYDKTTLSQFLPEHGALDEVAIPRLPQDAGALVIDATTSIALDGNMISNAAPGGRGAQVDIVADQLEIVTQFDEAATAVQLDAADLNNFGAESILVGGTRASEADGVRIAVGAERVTVKSGVELEVPELILVAGAEDAASPEAATAGVHVESGATLRGKGEFSGRASNVTIGKEKIYDDKGNLVDPGVSGGGALLRVASANQISVRRANSETGTGALTIAEGATIGADESMVLDATGASQIEGTLDISGGSLNLGAEKVSLGDVPVNTEGLTITNADLSNWALRELVLTSRGNIDFHGDVNFGTDTGGNTLLQSLAFETTGLQNHGGDTTVTAGSIRLTSAIAAGQGEKPVTGDSGTLTLNARVMNDAGAEPREIDGTGELLLGEGYFSVAGYAQANFNAERRITSEGEGQLRVAADVNLDAPLLTTGAGARVTIDAGNHAVTIASSTASDEAGNLGGSLAIKGGTVEHNGNIRVRSGRVDLQARAGDVVVKDGSVIDVSGISKQFDDVTVDTWGGKVVLRADDGNVDVQSGSLIDVAGADSGGGADAGSLSVQALGEGENGKVTLAGTLHGDAQDGFAQGSFDVDARELVATMNGFSGFSELNRTLNSGGFNERRAVRLRSGDITVEAGAENAVAARNVTLTAEGADAAIVVNGSVGQAADKGGAVSLNAQGDVTLADGAEIIASAQGDGERGGKVLLSSDHGVITVSSGSRIDTSASAVGDGRDGSVTLRAARKDSDGDGQDDGVNIAPIAGTITGAAKVVAEAVKVYANDGDVTIDAANLVGWKTATQDFMDQHGAQIATDLDPAGQLPLTVSPGVEVRSTGAITLEDEWDLSSWRYGDAPGALTLRAQNNMQLDKSITDGFRANVLQSDDSWSYRIIGGADTGSANMLAVLPTEQLAENGGSVILAANSKVRTGNGSIDVVAGGNVELKDTSSVIYTAGVPAVKDGVVVQSESISTRGYVANETTTGNQRTFKITKNWSDQGGDVSVTAGQDLLGELSNYSPALWLWRQGGKKFSTDYDTQWAVDFSGFQHGVAAFGGGDVQLSAGRDIQNFSAAIPTTGKQASPGADRSIIDTWGGGDLSVFADRNLQGGIYLVGKGVGDLQASGVVGGGKNNISPWLVLGKGRFSVRAGSDLTLETVSQPTAIPRTAFFNDKQYLSDFLTYDPFSGVDMVSLGGNITFQPRDSGAIASLFYDTKALSSPKDKLNLLPPSLRAVALGGSIDIINGAFLLPSSTGQFELLAEKNVGSIVTSTIHMSDYDPELLPSPSTPVTSFKTLLLPEKEDDKADLDTHALEPLHNNDKQPAYIVANNGNITGQYILPKQTHVVAGRDIKNVGLSIQNVNPTDVTLIEAGRDIRFTQSQFVDFEKIQVDGPGRVDVIAGRNLNLGASDGITTRGNQANSALPDGGADVNVLVGVANGLNYDAFIQAYLVDSEVYRSDVTSYMRTRLNQPELSDADALQAFLDAPVIEQRPLIMQTLYAELNAAGIAASNGTGSYESGYEAINTLFDSEHGYDGDLSMYLSRIYTLDGGDINLAVPGGEVNAGLAVSTSSIGVPKEPDQLGIVVQRQGSVSAMVDKSFIVNQSRVFTLGGGDLMLWSSYGDIDAGRGAKSAISAPEPVYIFNANGALIPDFGGAISGSGIRVISTLPGVEAGTTYLWAPEGKIDAGDAGIEAGSNLFLGAQQVIGADNIKVGGASFGTPIAAAGNLAAGLSGVSSLASNASKSAEDAVAGNAKDTADTPLADAALSFLEVEVLGFGVEQKSEAQETQDDREQEESKDQ